ncbi:MAG: 5'-nucleotidase [Bdellovibrio bacteriovorus]
MNAPLTDDVWIRRGINVLWDGGVLARLGAGPKVISLRRFFELDEAEWPEDETPLVGDSAVMVAGLDVALDALGADEAEEWIQQMLYPRIYEFQRAFAGQSALIFWMAEKERWKENSGEGTFDWHLGGAHQGQLLPLGRCLWDGAYSDVRPIEEPGPKGQAKWIGLYLPRIS